MNEIENILEPKERVEWTGNPKASAYFTAHYLMLTAIASVFGILLYSSQYSKLWLLAVGGGWLVLMITTTLSYFKIFYAITNKRVILQSGLIGRDFKSVDYDQIQNVSVKRGIFDVIFGIGSIRIFSGEMEMVSGGSRGNRYGGTRAKYDVFSHIPDSYSVLKLVQTHLSKRKENLYAGRT